MRKLVRFLLSIEDGLIVLILLLMIGLAVYQIVLRNVFGSSLVWVEPLLRNAVLWIGLLGAMIASRRDEHIRIDLLNNYLSPAAKRWLAVLVDLFTCVICGLVAGYSAVFVVQEEMAYGTQAFSGMPSWVLQAIIPFGFAVIALRYLALFVLGLIDRRPVMQEPHA